MSAIVKATRGWFVDVWQGWNRFWFTPARPHTLALIRILAGLMLFYTHMVWSLDLLSFLGPNSWITREVSQQINPGSYTWSYFYLTNAPAVVWTLHIAALVVFAMLTVGLFTRVVSVLAFLITVSYCHRLFGSLFGLDQVNAMLAMYLMVGPCGDTYSLDRWLANRKMRSVGERSLEPGSRVSTNVAIRLIQLHMCVIYLFGGIAKMKGSDWWDGDAVWYAVANLEYQSFDMTWMVHAPFLVSWLSLITIFWETFYCCLVWPRMTRPIVLAIAVGVHGGIALFLGMITFGLAMLIGNLAFVSPATIRRLVDGCCRCGRAGEQA